MKSWVPGTSRRCQHRMPGAYLKKYFGENGLNPKDANAQRRAEKFLARELKVKPDEVNVSISGLVFLSRRAYARLASTDLDDLSFIASGGRLGAIYEGAEMAYNDVLAGTVQASGESLGGRLRRTAKNLYSKLPKPIRELTATMRENGTLETITGLGAGLALGVGVWLGIKGSKQIRQGLARGDLDQSLKGARFLFLGAEATAASAALAAKVTSHSFFKVAGRLATEVAAPAFAVVHGVIDIAQGSHHIKEGLQKKDNWKVLEGLAEIGMGAGWLAAAFTTTPVIVGISCLSLGVKLGSSVLSHRREKKLAEEEPAKHLAVLESMRPGGQGDKELVWESSNQPELQPADQETKPIWFIART